MHNMRLSCSQHTYLGFRGVPGLVMASLAIAGLRNYNEYLSQALGDVDQK